MKTHSISLPSKALGRQVEVHCFSKKEVQKENNVDAEQEGGKEGGKEGRCSHPFSSDDEICSGEGVLRAASPPGSTLPRQQSPAAHPGQAGGAHLCFQG